jgi:hypothetical protein
VRKKPPKDDESNTLRAKLDIIKADYHNAREQDRYKRSGVWGKTKQNTKEGYSLVRALAATGEFSFVLRQGKMLMFHPIRAKRQLHAAFRAFANEETARAIENEIEQHPWFEEATKIDKLALTKDSSGPLSKQEEFAVGKWLGKIPVLKELDRFNRAGRVFLNKMRWDTYVAMRGAWSRFGTATPEERERYATMVNEFTGRGSIKSLEKYIVAAGQILWSPRFLLSRIQAKTMHTLWGGTKRSKALIAMEYARAMAGLQIYTLITAYLLGDDDDQPALENDKRSSDYGKIRVGKDTRLDPMAGFAQTNTYLARLYHGEVIDAKGDIIDIRGDDKDANSTNVWALTGKFGASKMHPAIVKGLNLLAGQDIYGNRRGLGIEASEAGPMTWYDIAEALENHGYSKGAALGLLAFFGEGLNHYEQRAKAEKFGDNPPTWKLVKDAADLAFKSEGPRTAGKESLAARREAWKAEKASALEWLTANRDDPTVQAVLTPGQMKRLAQ